MNKRLPGRLAVSASSHLLISYSGVLPIVKVASLVGINVTINDEHVIHEFHVNQVILVFHLNHVNHVVVGEHELTSSVLAEIFWVRVVSLDLFTIDDSLSGDLLKRTQDGNRCPNTLLGAHLCKVKTSCGCTVTRVDRLT